MIGFGEAFSRGHVFHAIVGDEERLFRSLHGEQAHAAVLAKLKRADITLQYRFVLETVERRLRPSWLGRLLPRLRTAPPRGSARTLGQLAGTR